MAMDAIIADLVENLKDIPELRDLNFTPFTCGWASEIRSSPVENGGFSHYHCL